MRYVYNTTFLPPEGKAPSFVAAMKEEILPRLAAWGVAAEPLFTGVSVDGEEGEGFSLQLIFAGEADYRRFMENHRQRLLDAVHAASGEGLLHFSSILKEII